MAKGSAFEREISKKLSLWWSRSKRDDIFWRSSQSGGRATQRAKTGQRTFGSYGDITAVDPIGAPLLRYFTIELKRGRSHSCLGDLLDVNGSNDKRPFIIALRQARRSARHAGSETWLLICRRDRRQAMVYLSRRHADVLLGSSTDYPGAYCRVMIKKNLCCIAAVSLDLFLSRVRPQEIINRYRG